MFDDDDDDDDDDNGNGGAGTDRNECSGCAVCQRQSCIVCCSTHLH